MHMTRFISVIPSSEMPHIDIMPTVPIRVLMTLAMVEHAARRSGNKNIEIVITVMPVVRMHCNVCSNTVMYWSM